MKNVFVGLLAVALVTVTPAVAKDNYLGILGGAQWSDVISTPIAKEKTGVVVGGVYGFQTSIPNVRVEAEVAFRQNDVELFGGKLNVSQEMFSVMGNVIYDIPIALGPIHPSVLAGVGVGSHSATLEDISIIEVSNTGFAWQVGADLNTQVAEGVTFGVGYRYFQGPDLNVFGTELSDGSSHNLMAHLNFAL